MVKTYRNKQYDTETMTVAKKEVFGTFGDPTGYEEIVFVAANGQHFLYGNGGAESKYPEETLTALTKAKAAAILA